MAVEPSGTVPRAESRSSPVGVRGRSAEFVVAGNRMGRRTEQKRRGRNEGAEVPAVPLPNGYKRCEEEGSASCFRGGDGVRYPSGTAYLGVGPTVGQGASDLAGGMFRAGGTRFPRCKRVVGGRGARRMERSHPVRLLAPPYATRTHVLRWYPEPGRERVVCHVTADEIAVSFPVSMPSSSPEVQAAAREGALRALRAEAKALLPGMVEELAARYGFRYGKVTVRATRSRWGSCSSRNDISLSIFLVRLPLPLIEYVIVHELCHTCHKDHSARFHALADTLLGGREKELAREIRRYVPDVV